MSIEIFRERIDVCPAIFADELNDFYGGTPFVEFVRIDDEVEITVSYETTPSTQNLTDLDTLLASHDCSLLDDDETIGDNLTGNILNNSGTKIPGGYPVYLTGFDSTAMLSTIAKAESSDQTKIPAVGCTTSDILDGAIGSIVTNGQLTNVDTSSFAVGDQVYVGSSGGFSATKPSGTNLIQKIGQVQVANAISGRIQVFGAGRSNDLPNLTQNKVWMGDTGGVPEEVDIYKKSDVDSLLIGKSDTSHTHPSADIHYGNFQAGFHYDDYAANRWLEHVPNRSSSQTPYLMPFNSKLIAITFTNYYTSRETDIIIYAAGEDEGAMRTLRHTFPIRNTRAAFRTTITPEVTFSAGDKVALFLKDQGSNVYDPMVILYFERTDNTIFADSSVTYSGAFASPDTGAGDD